MGGQHGLPGDGRGATWAATPNTEAPTATLDALHEQARAHDPEWRILTLRVPASGAPVVYPIDRGDGGQPQLRGTLTINPLSGARWEGFDAQTAGRRARSWLRFLHTGEAAGAIGQTTAGLVSAGAVVLVYSGFALSWRRFRAMALSRAARRADSATRPARRHRAR